MVRTPTSAAGGGGQLHSLDPLVVVSALVVFSTPATPFR